MGNHPTERKEGESLLEYKNKIKLAPAKPTRFLKVIRYYNVGFM